MPPAGRQVLPRCRSNGTLSKTYAAAAVTYPDRVANIYSGAVHDASFERHDVRRGRRARRRRSRGPVARPGRDRHRPPRPQPSRHDVPRGLRRDVRAGAAVRPADDDGQGHPRALRRRLGRVPRALSDRRGRRVVPAGVNSCAHCRMTMPWRTLHDLMTTPHLRHDSTTITRGRASPNTAGCSPARACIRHLAPGATALRRPNRDSDPKRPRRSLPQQDVRPVDRVQPPDRSDGAGRPALLQALRASVMEGVVPTTAPPLRPSGGPRSRAPRRSRGSLRPRGSGGPMIF